MCRIEEKVYIGSDGRSRTFQDTFDCDRARRRGKRCSKPEIRTREYRNAPQNTRDETSSPASNNPPTPTGVGSYVVEERRPSASGGRRPSLRPPTSVKPEIIIQIGSNKGRDAKYPRTYVSKTYKRSSLGASPSASNDVVIDSPGSDASYPIRTGLPDTAVPQTPPFGQPQYTKRAAPHTHRHTASASSVTTSQTPSLYTTSETEPDSPLDRHAPHYPRTVVHNSRSNPSPPTTAPGRTAQPSSYHTRLDVPNSSSRDTSSSRDNADDYSHVVDLYASSNVSNASSTRGAAPEITDRAIDRERRRRKDKEAEEERRLDDALSQAERLAAEQAKKEVRFAALETGRYEERDRLRKEQNDKRKVEEQREHDRQQKSQSKKHTVKETRATKPERPKTQPPTSYNNPKQPSGGRRSRRNSVTQADIDEHARLLQQDKLQMSLERAAAEQREHEEASQQRYATRVQPPPPHSYPVVEPRPAVAGRRRLSIVDPPALTPLNTAFPPQQTYTARPPNSHTQPYTTREPFPSARYSPSQTVSPFVQPTRTSNPNMENNPFAAPSTRPIHPSQPLVPAVQQHHYPAMAPGPAWDTQSMQAALSHPPGHPAQYANQAHGRAQQATRNLNQTYQTHDEWA